MPNPGKCIFVFVIACSVMLLGASAYAQAVVQATLSSDVITIDDTATLQILTDSNASDVDFSPLTRDFNVIARSNSQQVQISNGKERIIQAWVLELAPKDVGVFTLPPITVGNVQSDPVQITVTEASAGGARVLFLTAEVDKSEVYVQEQVILTIKVHEAVQIFDQQITSLRHDDLVIHNLGKELVVEEVIDGQRYRVREQRFAIFPQKSGEIEIPQLLLSASVPKDTNAVQGFFRDSKWIKRRTPAITLNVNARPDAQNAAWWLPAKKVSLFNRWTPRTAVVSISESLGEGQLSTIANSGSTDNSNQSASMELNRGSATLRVDIDQPITRVLKIVGEAVASNSLPDIALPVIDGLDLYAEDVVSTSRQATHGMDTIQDITWAIIPQRPGIFELPEVRVEWFNTATGQPEYAVLPPQTIEVIGEALASTTENDTNDAATAPVNTAQSDDMDDSSNAHARPEAGDTPDTQTPGDAVVAGSEQTVAATSVWKWLALAALLGWLATIAGFVWWRNTVGRLPSAKQSEDTGQTWPRVDSQSAMRALKSSIQQREASDVLQKLLVWGESVWPNNPPGHIAQIAERLPSAELKDLLGKLDAELYQVKQEGSDASWDALAALPEQLEDAQAAADSRANALQIAPDGLPSL